MTQFKAPPIPTVPQQPQGTSQQTQGAYPQRPAARPMGNAQQQNAYAPSQHQEAPQSAYGQQQSYPPVDQPAPGSIPTGMDVNTTDDMSDDVYADTIVARVSPSLLKTKTVYAILAGILVLGMILGNMMFGGSSSGGSQKNAAAALGVITNPDIKEHLRRCGQVDKGEACILYIMNHTRYDKIAEDFFDTAVKLMEVQRYSVSMVNPKYAKTRIPPGYFVQLKIPNVR